MDNLPRWKDAFRFPMARRPRTSDAAIVSRFAAMLAG
jgi:hypothetical protein